MHITLQKDHDIRMADGTIKACFAGQTYDVPHEAATTLVKTGAAVKAKAVAAPPEDKAVSSEEVDNKGVAGDGGAGGSSGQCPTCRRHFADLEGHRERAGH